MLALIAVRHAWCPTLGRCARRVLVWLGWVRQPRQVRPPEEAAEVASRPAVAAAEVPRLAAAVEEEGPLAAAGEAGGPQARVAERPAPVVAAAGPPEVSVQLAHHRDSNREACSPLRVRRRGTSPFWTGVAQAAERLTSVGPGVRPWRCRSAQRRDCSSPAFWPLHLLPPVARHQPAVQLSMRSADVHRWMERQAALG